MYPKYPLLRTIRALLRGTWGVLVISFQVYSGFWRLWVRAPKTLGAFGTVFQDPSNLPEPGEALADFEKAL